MGVRGRPKTERTKQLERQIIEAITEDHPQSVRHVFYQMTNPKLHLPVDKDQSGYNCVQRLCVRLRRQELIPYGWIVDSTRRGYHVLPFDDAGDLIEHFSGLYRQDLWARTQDYVEVWCESDSIAGVIESECQRVGVSLYPTRGFCSVTLIHQAAEGIRTWARQRPVKIIYVGDFDPAGILIDDKVLEGLRGHLSNHSIEKMRVAVTAEQAKDLPSKPRKKGDKRLPGIKRTVEAEAIPAGELRKMVRNTVEQFLPKGALHAARVAEASEQAGLRRLAELTSRHGIDRVNDIVNRHKLQVSEGDAS